MKFFRNSLSDFRKSWLPLAAAVLLAPFANGADAVSLAAWLFPVFLLRFTRQQRPLLGLPLAYVILTGALAFQFRGMVPLPGPFLYLFLATEGAILLVSYAIDRALAPRLSGISATLVFPCAFTLTEYLSSLGPFGSWCSIAYTQAGNLALLQLLSVTGLWGITFLIAWFAAGCNAVWQNGLPNSMGVARLIGGAVVMASLAGGIRLAVFPPHAPTVRVASLSARILVSPHASQGIDVRRANMLAVDQDLLQRAEKEMQAGAKIVFWAEGNAVVRKADEPSFIGQGQIIARRHHAYLGMAMMVLHGGQPSRFENKLVLIGPDGHIAWTYHKARPVPGPEATLTIPGDSRMKLSRSNYGRLSGFICFDGDFPQVVAQAGILGADIVLDPSNDWRAIDPLHTRMAGFRAVEQGVNLVRQTSHGLSAAYDYQGHALAVMDHFQSTDFSLVAQVPTHGAATLYGRFGDWFAWLAGLTLLALAATRISGHRE